MSKLDLVAKWIAELVFVAIVIFVATISFMLGESLGKRKGCAQNQISNFVVETNSVSLRTLRFGDFCAECQAKLQNFYGKQNN